MIDTQQDSFDRRAVWRSSLIIGAAVLILCAPVLLQPGSVMYPARGQFSDLTITHWPAFDYLRASLRQTGGPPLWRTSILGGTPFAADPVTGVWYPPNWLSIVLPLEWFFKVIVAAHLFLGGLGMSRLARSFGVGWIGAVASGAAYAIAPRAIAHAGAGHITIVEAWAWMPWIVWAARRDATVKGALASGIALGACALADLRVAAYAGAMVVLYALAATRASAARRIACALAILFTASAISAAVWLPALALAGESTRAGLTPGEASVYSLPAEYLLGTLLAGRGDPERLTYVGLPVLLLAPVGLRRLWRDERRPAVWLLVLAALGVLGAMGSNTPLYQLTSRLPGVSLLRVPGRAWFLVAFAAALACGIGAHSLMSRAFANGLSRAQKLAGLLVGSFALSFGAGGALIVFAGGQAGAERVGLSLVGLAVLVPSTIALVAARLQGRLAPLPFGAGALLLIAVDLLWVGSGHYRVAAIDEAFADGRAVAQYLQRASGDASILDGAYAGTAFVRVYSPSYSLPQHVAQAHRIELADGIDPLQLGRTVRFMQAATGVGEWGYSVTLPAFVGLEQDEDIRSWLANVVPDPALLGLLGVRYIVAHYPIAHPDLSEAARIDGVYVYENARWQPTVRVVGRVDTAASQAEAMRWLSTHDPDVEAVVEGGRPLRLDIDGVQARIVVREPDRVTVSARGPGLLVLGEAYARDWRASVDGVSSPVVPTDGVLRGVYLEEGEHTIEFVYDPVAVKVGGALSGVALLGWIVYRMSVRRQWPA